MRLIDADAMKADLLTVDPQYETMIQWCCTVIDAQPTIEERKRGKWLRYGEDGNPNDIDTVFWQCDQCLERYTGRTTRIPHYCPNCGADMRGDSDEA